MKKILIDNGHGANTPGKKSPDGIIKEYAYTRVLADMLVDALRKKGYDAERIVKEEIDVPLKERVRRVNQECREHGQGNVLLISLHLNAAGDGSQWCSARGWECYTSYGKTKADKLATMLCEEAKLYSDNIARVRVDLSDGDPDKEANFYILKHTQCAAVLTENGFMDNKDDVQEMLTDEYKQIIVDIHVKAIERYLEKER